MKRLLNKVLEAIVVLLSIFILGIFLPMSIVLIVTSFTNAHIDECIMYPGFWVLSIIGWIIADCYMDHILKDENVYPHNIR